MNEYKVISLFIKSGERDQLNISSPGERKSTAFIVSEYVGTWYVPSSECPRTNPEHVIF